jgi:hypothetical protein
MSQEPFLGTTLLAATLLAFHAAEKSSAHQIAVEILSSVDSFSMWQLPRNPQSQAIIKSYSFSKFLKHI